MAFRKFKGIEYPVPGIDTAIATLRPGAKWGTLNNSIVEWQDDQGREPPTWDEVEAEVVREVEIYNYYLYERNREKEYPSIVDQLDMIYHDIKSGNLNNGDWITSIDLVKNNNPKPDGPEPVL